MALSLKRLLVGAPLETARAHEEKLPLFWRCRFSPLMLCLQWLTPAKKLWPRCWWPAHSTSI
jgi:hypothetical protein